MAAGKGTDAAQTFRAVQAPWAQILSPPIPMPALGTETQLRRWDPVPLPLPSSGLLWVGSQIGRRKISPPFSLIQACKIRPLGETSMLINPNLPG